MADRTPGVRLGGDEEALLREIVRRLGIVELDVKKLQDRGGGQLPADFRYTRVAVAGGYAVVIERVSQGTSEQITGPL